MTLTVETPSIEDLDYRPVGDAMAESGKMIADLFNAALDGAVFPGMNGPITVKSAKATYQTPGQFELIVIPPMEIAKVENGTEPWDMKCIIDPRSRVLTVSGWKFIKDVVVGDLVLTHKGRFRHVLAVSKEPLEQRQNVVKVCYRGKKGVEKSLLITPNHPFLVGDQWIRADNLHVGSKLKLLATACANPSCDRLAPFYRETCSINCRNAIVNLRASKNGNHSSFREDKKEQHREHMRALTKQLLAEGKHVTQRPDVRAMWKERIDAGEHPFQKAWKEHPEELMRAASVALGKKHHGKTTLEDKMANVLVELGFSVSWSSDHEKSDFIRQFMFKRQSLKKEKWGGVRNRWYFLDFADVKNKINIECNGERWHTPEKDAIRKDELEAAGWAVLFFPSKQIYRETESVKKSISALYSNHNGDFGFLDVECIRAERVNTHHGFKYNLQVEEDESFVCNGIVVHNSSLLNGPRHRVSKTGSRYNIIPFKHDRSKMPSDIGKMADTLEASAIIGTYMDKNDYGPVERNVYRWGESHYGPWRLPSMPVTSLMDLSVSGTGYVRKHSRYSGMVKMEGTRFMTFRTVSDKSPPESWWHPGKPANPVTPSIEAFAMPFLESKIVAAWEEVLRRW